MVSGYQDIIATLIWVTARTSLGTTGIQRWPDLWCSNVRNDSGTSNRFCKNI